MGVAPWLTCPSSLTPSATSRLLRWSSQLAHIRTSASIDSAPVARPLLRQRGQVHQDIAGGHGLARLQRRRAPRLGLFGHATPIRVAAHRGRRGPGRVLAGTRSSTSVPLPLRVSATSRTGWAEPRSRTSPTPRLIPPSLGLRRYCTVRQRVFGFLSYANSTSSGFSDLSVALGVELAGAGDRDRSRGRRRRRRGLPATRPTARRPAPPASRWSSTRADTIARRDQQQGQQDQRPDPAARRPAAGAGDWNRAGRGVCAAGDRPRVSEVVTTVGRSPVVGRGADARVRRARAESSRAETGGAPVGDVGGRGAGADQRDGLPQPALQVAGRVGRPEHLGQGDHHVVRGGDRAGPVPRRVAEDLVADVVQRRRDPGPDLPRRNPAAADHRRVRQAERRPAGPAGHQAGVEQPAQVGDVDQLAGCRRPCTTARAGRTQRRLDQQPDDLDVAVRGDDHGVRVDPLVVQPEAVHAGQRVGDLADHPGRLQRRTAAPWLRTSSSDWPVAYSQTM